MTGERLPNDSGFAHLPPDLWDDILKRLPVRDRAQLRQVSKELKAQFEHLSDCSIEVSALGFWHGMMDREWQERELHRPRALQKLLGSMHYPAARAGLSLAVGCGGRFEDFDARASLLEHLNRLCNNIRKLMLGTRQPMCDYRPDRSDDGNKSCDTVPVQWALARLVWSSFPNLRELVLSCGMHPSLVSGEGSLLHRALQRCPRLAALRLNVDADADCHLALDQSERQSLCGHESCEVHRDTDLTWMASSVKLSLSMECDARLGRVLAHPLHALEVYGDPAGALVQRVLGGLDLRHLRHLRLPQSSWAEIAHLLLRCSSQLASLEMDINPHEAPSVVRQARRLRLQELAVSVFYDDCDTHLLDCSGLTTLTRLAADGCIEAHAGADASGLHGFCSSLHQAASLNYPPRSTASGVDVSHLFDDVRAMSQRLDYFFHVRPPEGLLELRMKKCTARSLPPRLVALTVLHSCEDLDLRQLPASLQRLHIRGARRHFQPLSPLHTGLTSLKIDSVNIQAPPKPSPQLCAPPLVEMDLHFRCGDAAAVQRLCESATLRRVCLHCRDDSQAPEYMAAELDLTALTGLERLSLSTPMPVWLPGVGELQELGITDEQLGAVSFRRNADGRKGTGAPASRGVGLESGISSSPCAASFHLQTEVTPGLNHARTLTDALEACIHVLRLAWTPPGPPREVHIPWLKRAACTSWARVRVARVLTAGLSAETQEAVDLLQQRYRAR